MAVAVAAGKKAAVDSAETAGAAILVSMEGLSVSKHKFSKKNNRLIL